MIGRPVVVEHLQPSYGSLKRGKDGLGACQPLQRKATERLDRAFAERGKVARQEHSPAELLAQALDARGGVDRLADNGEVETVGTADIAVEHLADMQCQSVADLRPAQSVTFFVKSVDSLAGGRSRR